jgi:hypothetical protein
MNAYAIFAGGKTIDPAERKIHNDNVWPAIKGYEVKILAAYGPTCAGKSRKRRHRRCGISQHGSGAGLI